MSWDSIDGFNDWVELQQVRHMLRADGDVREQADGTGAGGRGGWGRGGGNRRDRDETMRAHTFKNTHW